MKHAVNNVFRAQQKHRVWRDARKYQGQLIVMCELCHKRPATDLHEIINRASLTETEQSNYPDTLCAAICNECNTTIADMFGSRGELVRYKMLQYGLEVFAFNLREWQRINNRPMPLAPFEKEFRPLFETND